MLSRIGYECVCVTALRTQLGVAAVRGDAAVATGGEQQKQGKDWTDTHGQMSLVTMLRLTSELGNGTLVEMTFCATSRFSFAYRYWFPIAASAACAYLDPR